MSLKKQYNDQNKQGQKDKQQWIGLYYEIEYVSCVKLGALKSDNTYITKRYKYGKLKCQFNLLPRAFLK
jgi:hypothetical protein